LQSVVTRLTGREDPEPCGTYEGDLRVCASNIGEFLKERLLVPFGMTSSAYVWSPALEGRMARRHDENADPLPERRPTATDAARYASSGGLLTTPGEYARFLAEVVAPRSPDDFRLGADTLGQMLRPAVEVSHEPASSWALGWQLLATPRGTVIAHGGDNPGTHCFAAASVERRSAFVVMTNGTGGIEVLRSIALGASMPALLDL
jgi:CubicO group peptidase (beta-lactamase class C family)